MLIPKLNDYHSLMLFWTKPTGDFMLAQKVLTSKQIRKRKSEILKNSLMYVLMLIVFVVLIVLLHILPVVSTK
jgi:K+-transporting ATPase A subunit